MGELNQCQAEDAQVSDAKDTEDAEHEPLDGDGYSLHSHIFSF